MDIEFHYYMTYLIAARAGFAPAQAETIAHAAQSVDDNHILYSVEGDPAGPYTNYISQTMNILKPTTRLLRIYPIFHFIPGDPDAPSAARKDGIKNQWVATPDSAVARKMIDNALASRDLYRIGVSAHGYVDTWAHQNFIGERSAANDMPGSGLLERLLNVGHGDAGHQPDKPALIWHDTRLVAELVDNRARFLDAAEALFRRFALYVDPSRSTASIDAECVALRADLDEDIGSPDPGSDTDLLNARIDRYCERAKTPSYGGNTLTLYDEYAWFNAAVAEDCASLRQKFDHLLDMAADYVDQTAEIPCNWHDNNAYRQSDWYLFVEAVQAHQNACWAIFVAEDLPGLDAPDL